MGYETGYELCIGDRAYSSWSLRGWLLFEAFGIGCALTRTRLYEPGFAQTLARFAPARTVPALRLPEGVVIGDSLAIAEELASRHPGAGLWPADPKARAIARHLAAEMHASFTALRGHCAMNLRVCYTDCAPPAAVLADLVRLEDLWAWARAECGGAGPWLCGEYSVADVFFAPVAARIAGHALPVSPAAQTYVAAHFAHLPFRRWRAMAQVDGADQPAYGRDWPTGDWALPEVLPSAPLATGPSVNAACPYSGLPVTHYLRVKGQVLGFCNAFCRDKTGADPEAWPQAMALLEP
ncbi:glutathione S-transferase [Pararhodobacter oceanensis]|uniref:glutathione S-transferase n=1 Tax=Pararhodobacter oceanensis TaxID=2172121 RepID=UPI003A914E21